MLTVLALSTRFVAHTSLQMPTYLNIPEFANNMAVALNLGLANVSALEVTPVPIDGLLYKGAAMVNGVKTFKDAIDKKKQSEPSYFLTAHLQKLCGGYLEDCLGTFLA